MPLPELAPVQVSVVVQGRGPGTTGPLPGFGGGAGPEAMIDRQDRQTAGGRLRGEPQQGHRIGSAGDGQRYMRMSRDGRGQQALIRPGNWHAWLRPGRACGPRRLGILRGFGQIGSTGLLGLAQAVQRNAELQQAVGGAAALGIGLVAAQEGLGGALEIALA